MAYPDPPPSDGKMYVLQDGDWVAINPLDDGQDLDFNGRRGRNAAASDLGGDYVTRQELDGLIANLSATIALKVDGTNQMLADADIGTNKLVNVEAGTADSDGVNKGQMDDGDDAAEAAAVATANAYTDAAMQTGGQPNNLQLFASPGTNSWTKPAGVTTFYVWLCGGYGGGGGSGYRSGGYANTRGGAGGAGATESAIITRASASEVIEFTVGGGGGRGASQVGTSGTGAGGGGGGATTFLDVVAGGGGGGGGGGMTGVSGSGGNGGGGGAAGSNGNNGAVGGTAGTGGTAQGGAGGSGGGISQNGSAGASGTTDRGAQDIIGMAAATLASELDARTPGYGAGDPIRALDGLTVATGGSHGFVIIAWRS